MSNKRMTIEKNILFEERGGCSLNTCVFLLLFILWIFDLYQPPTRNNTTMASSASNENQRIFVWPNGTIINAASNGPKELPALPPTWKIDCAKPLLLPAAIYATLEASG